MLPTKNNSRPSRLGGIFGFLKSSSDINDRDILPHSKGALPTPAPPPTPASDLKMPGNDALQIWEKKHVVAQVQLPV